MKTMDISQEKMRGHLIFHSPCLSVAHSHAPSEKLGCLDKLYVRNKKAVYNLTAKTLQAIKKHSENMS